MLFYYSIKQLSYIGIGLARRLAEKQIRSAKRKSQDRSKARTRGKRAKSYTGTVRHKTRYGAISHLNSLRHAQMELYECRHCKGWHIRHQWTPTKLQLKLDQPLA